MTYIIDNQMHKRKINELLNSSIRNIISDTMKALKVIS